MACNITGGRHVQPRSVAIAKGGSSKRQAAGPIGRKERQSITTQEGRARSGKAGGGKQREAKGSEAPKEGAQEPGRKAGGPSRQAAQQVAAGEAWPAGQRGSAGAGGPSLGYCESVM